MTSSYITFLGTTSYIWFDLYRSYFIFTYKKLLLPPNAKTISTGSITITKFDSCDFGKTKTNSTYKKL